MVTDAYITTNDRDPEVCPACEEHVIDCLCAERREREGELDWFQEKGW